MIVTASYGQAGALEHFRAGRFDEPVTSPDRGYWFLAPAALVVGDVSDGLRTAFTTTTPLGTYDNPYGVATLNGRVPLTLLTDRTTPVADDLDRSAHPARPVIGSSVPHTDRRVAFRYRRDGHSPEMTSYSPGLK